MPPHNMNLQVAPLVKLPAAEDAPELRLHLALETHVPPQMGASYVGFIALRTRKYC